MRHACKRARGAVRLDTAAALAALARERLAERPPLYGDGRAGERVVQALLALRERVPVA